MSPFLLGPDERAALQELRKRASRDPVDMPGLLERLATPAGKRAHMDRMNRLSLQLPFGYVLTYSIERGHPSGTCRHMSLSSPNPARLPLPAAVWMVAEELGFSGSLADCAVWLEELQRGGPEDPKHQAVNVVQPLAVAMFLGIA